MPTDRATAEAIAALQREMDVHGRGRDEPVRSISAYVGDRWSALILLVLLTGTWRHAELRRTLAEISFEGAISQRILTLKLRAFERDGLLLRAATSDVPPKVSYTLTATGRGLVGQVRGLIDWANAHQAEILAARTRFDSETSSD